MYALPAEANGPVEKGWEPLPEFMRSIPSEHVIPKVSKCFGILLGAIQKCLYLSLMR